MPVFPWRFIDSLLGRSRPGDEDPATDEDIDAEVARLSSRLEADIASAEDLNDTAKAALRGWSATMLRRRAPAADGRSRRDMHVQLGAVSGAVRAVVQALDEALAAPDATSQRLIRHLRAVESEIGSPLYTLEEQSLVRARVDRVLDQLDGSDQRVDLATAVPRLVKALTPPDS
jgi:hypothetical protein